MSQYADLLNVGKMMLHTHKMVMWPKLWKKLQLKTPLTWSTYPFTAASSPLIPNQQGVYAFLVRPTQAGVLGISYLMYIGETERPLRVRFKEYLLETNSKRIRPNLLRILPLYTGYIDFACAPLPTSVVPEEIETALIGAFLPPGNNTIKSAAGKTRKAFR